MEDIPGDINKFTLIQAQVWPALYRSLRLVPDLEEAAKLAWKRTVGFFKREDVKAR